MNLRHVFDEDFCRFVVNVAAVCGFRALHNVFARHAFDEIDCLHIFAVVGFDVFKPNDIAAGCGRSVVGENIFSVCVRLVAGEFDFFDVSFSDDVIEINRALQAVNHGAGVVGQLFHIFQRHGKDARGRRAETFCRYAVEQVSVFEHVVALRFQSFGVFAGFQIDVRRTIGNVSNLNFRRLARNGFQAVADKIAAFKVDDFNGFDAREHAVSVNVLCAARAVQAVVDGHFSVACAEGKLLEVRDVLCFEADLGVNEVIVGAVGEHHFGKIYFFADFVRGFKSFDFFDVGNHNRRNSASYAVPTVRPALFGEADHRRIVDENADVHEVFVRFGFCESGSRYLRRSVAFKRQIERAETCKRIVADCFHGAWQHDVGCGIFNLFEGFSRNGFYGFRNDVGRRSRRAFDVNENTVHDSHVPVGCPTGGGHAVRSDKFDCGFVFEHDVLDVCRKSFFVYVFDARRDDYFVGSVVKVSEIEVAENDVVAFCRFGSFPIGTRKGRRSDGFDFAVRGKGNFVHLAV